MDSHLVDDIVNVLFLLAPAAAVLCMILAFIHLRHEGGITFSIGGGFTRYMMWAIVFLTLHPMLSWFSGFGIHTQLPSGVVGDLNTPWMQTLVNDINQFVNSFIVARLAPTIAAFFVLRAILDAANGENPLASIVVSMLLLGIQTTISMIQGFNSNTQ